MVPGGTIYSGFLGGGVCDMYSDLFIVYVLDGCPECPLYRSCVDSVQHLAVGNHVQVKFVFRHFAWCQPWLCVRDLGYSLYVSIVV